MTSRHETARHLRVLLAHLDRHPALPAVTSAGTGISGELEVTVESDGGVAAFLEWSDLLEHPRLRIVAATAPGDSTMLKCRGLIRGYVITVVAHVRDLPNVDDRSEPIPLIGFRSIVARAQRAIVGGEGR